MGTFPLKTVVSYLDTQEACLQHGVKVDFVFTDCSLVTHSRTLLGNTFLAKRDFNRLFWIDSDIVWSPLDFMKLVVHSLKYDCVAGIYPRRVEAGGYFVSFTDPGVEPNEDGLVEIEGTGLGFACIRREVMERLAERVPKLRYFGAKEPVPALFREDSADGQARGEDYAFWSDVKDMGYRIYADATIRLGHIGGKVYQCPSLPLQK
jgi:hypothetical protein